MFSNSGSSGYGGCGYVTAISDNEILAFATRGNSTFHFSGRNVSSVETGAYINGIWKAEQTLNVSGGAISITSDMAKAGTLIRVIFD